jgi:DNA (cytosine-5)-methyltransferase 1
MNHREKLIEIYNLSYSISNIKDIPANQIRYINSIGEKVYSQKGVYTVLVTLIVHKILHSDQDIRYHQSNMKNGFSGRTIDTQFITPTLKELDLPSMAESGWLTRSLEQPYPYTLEYNGHISDKEVREAFLNIIDFVQKYPKKAKDVLRTLLNKVIILRNKNKVKIVVLKDADKFSIENIIDCLNEHFSFNYKIAGGSKLPVLAFYAVYQLLIKELKRFDRCLLSPLGSHTACDRTSFAAGDIQIFKEKKLIEALEIKLGRDIDKTVVRIAAEKIIKHNPQRYYILSSKGILEKDREEIRDIVLGIKENHGCLIIINGLIASLKYYLRLVSSTEGFIKAYSNLVGTDTELKKIHKEKWNEILKKYQKSKK